MPILAFFNLAKCGAKLRTEAQNNDLCRCFVIASWRCYLNQSITQLVAIGFQLRLGSSDPITVSVNRTGDDSLVYVNY
jgi:hypothetical protein